MGLGFSRWLLLAFVLGALALPGSEGWSGAVSRGDRLASEHRLLSAAAEYEAAARFPHVSPAVWVRLGDVFLKRGQGQEALDAFRRAEAVGMSSREVLLGLSSSQSLLGDTRGSLQTLERELALRPEHGEAWVSLVERAAHAGFRPREIGEMLVGSQTPRTPAALGQKADYLLGACVLGAASAVGIAALRRAAAGPDKGVGAVAREVLEVAGGSEAGDLRAISLAGVLLAQGLVGPALDSLDRVANGHPREVEGLALRGYALMRLGRHDEAEVHLRRSLELGPEHPVAEFFLGSLLRSRGDAEGAAALLARAARHDPGNPAIYAELANAALDLGDLSAAERALRLAVEAAPDSAELRLAVASLYVNWQYRVEDALADAGEAVRLTGRSAEALGSLGWALHLVGRSAGALDPLKEAVAKTPESPMLRYRLASVYEALRQPELAREQYLMVGELDGRGDQWRRARAALDGM